MHTLFLNKLIDLRYLWCDSRVIISMNSLWTKLEVNNSKCFLKELSLHNENRTLLHQHVLCIISSVSSLYEWWIYAFRMKYHNQHKICSRQFFADELLHPLGIFLGVCRLLREIHRAASCLQNEECNSYFANCCPSFHEMVEISGISKLAVTILGN